MSIPSRNADPENIVQSNRTFFVTTKTFQSQRLLQTDRNATLLIDVLRSCIRARRFTLHDFVIMPDHIHLLLTTSVEVTIEKAMQFIKGGFSFRLKRETGYEGEVWQPGFSDHRVLDPDSFANHRRYIAANPVKAGLAASPDEFPWCFRALARQKASRPAALKRDGEPKGGLRQQGSA
ncbi:MAG TPA: transposase [Acidobacteriaceae bacterium]|nr:transposase [Acidobacteriaceae bacterium]